MGKHEEFVASRARFGEWQEIQYSREPWTDNLTHGAEFIKELEKRVVIRIQHGTCHCGVCGHRWTYECEEADCQCCTEPCT